MSNELLTPIQAGNVLAMLNATLNVGFDQGTKKHHARVLHKITKEEMAFAAGDESATALDAAIRRAAAKHNVSIEDRQQADEGIDARWKTKVERDVQSLSEHVLSLADAITEMKNAIGELKDALPASERKQPLLGRDNEMPPDQPPPAPPETPRKK